MRELFHECVPAPLSRLLTGSGCQTVDQCGWKGLLNGALLRVAEGDFDVFITCDQNIRYQQNLTGFQISILELSTNDYRRLRASAALDIDTVAKMPNGVVVRLEIP